MRFVLVIDSNDASAIDNPDVEISRNLEKLSRQTLNGCAGAHGPILDLCGNIIGRYSFDAGETDELSAERMAEMIQEMRR